MVSDVTDWHRGSDRWYKFNTLEVELPMYREVCNEHPKSVLDIHMHTVCGVNGDRLCGVVNQMTVQIMLHDVIERWATILVSSSSRSFSSDLSSSRFESQENLLIWYLNWLKRELTIHFRRIGRRL